MASTSPLLSVSVTDSPHRVLLALHGEIDLATAPTLTHHIETALARRPATLVLDLAEVTFFGAQALNTVIAAQQAAAANDCRLELRSLPAIAKRVILASGFTDPTELGADDDTLQTL